MSEKRSKKIPKGTIEISLAGKRLGEKNIPGKSGVFESAEEAAKFYDSEKPTKRRKKRDT